MYPMHPPKLTYLTTEPTYTHAHTQTCLHTYTAHTPTKFLNKIKIKVFELGKMVQAHNIADTGEKEQLEARLGYTRSCLKKLKLINNTDG